jgi:hypothetical protein
MSGNVALYNLALTKFATQVSAMEETKPFFSGTPDVQVRKFDWDDIIKQSGVCIRYDRDEIKEGQGNIVTDFWGYPLYLVIVQEKQMQIDDEPQLLLSKIRNTYNHAQLLNVTSEGACNSATVVLDGPAVPQDRRTSNEFRNKDIYTLTVMAWFDEQ